MLADRRRSTILESLGREYLSGSFGCNEKYSVVTLATGIQYAHDAIGKGAFFNTGKNIGS